MTALRLLMVVAMAVVPGALVVVAAWVLAQVLATRARELQGPLALRLARAAGQVRWADVQAQVRRVV